MPLENSSNSPVGETYLVMSPDTEPEEYDSKASAYARAQQLGRVEVSVVRVARAGAYETRQQVWPVHEAIYSNGQF